jgi:hypothetical protein
MKIFVEWTKNNDLRCINLDVKLSDSVRSLKRQIQSKVSIPVSRQSLVFAGRQLGDDRTISDLVVNGGTLTKGSLVLVQGSQYSATGIKEFLVGTCTAPDENGQFNIHAKAADTSLASLKANESPTVFSAQLLGRPHFVIGIEDLRQLGLRDLKILGGSANHPLFLFEDFDAHTHIHDVKVMIGPTKIMKNADHAINVESTSGVKSRVFSLQVEYGTYTLWYSKLPQESASFFSSPKLSDSHSDLHHTMPLLGVIDLRFAAMFQSDSCTWMNPPTYPLTIDLRASHDHVNTSLSAKYFNCLKNTIAFVFFFPRQK